MLEKKEMDESGYMDLRAYVYWIWRYIQFEDENGDPIMRISVDDRRVRHIYDGLNKTINISVMLTGYDIEFDLPVTIGSMSIYKESEGGECLGISYYTGIVLEQEEHTALLQHRFQIPEVTK